MSRSRNRDGSKLSFSELDKRRREGRGDRSAQSGPGTASSHAQKAYLSALERAFETGRVQELAASLTRGARSGWDRDRAGGGGRPDAASGGAATPDAGAAAATDAGAATPPAERNAPAAPDPERAERRKLLAKIQAAEGRDEVSRAVTRYRARFGQLPDDYELLAKALIHNKAAIVVEALAALERKLAKNRPRRSRSLAAQLQLLEETHDDGDVRTRAAAVRAAL